MMRKGHTTMAYAPINIKALGSFKEKDHGKHFEYSANPDLILSPKAHGGKNVKFPHVLHVGPNGDQTRYALVLGNVAHVIVDETDDGDWVVEKWSIKGHRRYA